MTQPGANSGVEDALKQAVEGKAGSPPATTVTPAAATAPAATTVEDKGKTEGKGKHEDAVPYVRFKEVNDELSRIKESVTGKDTRVAQLEKEMDTLKKQVLEAEEDLDVLDRLRGLQKNEKYRPMLETLDKAINGIEEEVEEGKKTEKQGETEIRTLLDKQKREIQEEVTRERLDRLQSQADSLIDQYIQNLPSEYTNEEREIIRELTLPRVEWDAIQAKPTVMKDKIAAGLKLALEKHGQPRGVLESKIKALETKETTAPEVKAIDTAKVVEELVSKEWGARDDKGKMKFSDEDFTDALKKVVRHSNI